MEICSGAKESFGSFVAHHSKRTQTIWRNSPRCIQIIPVGVSPKGSVFVFGFFSGEVHAPISTVSKKKEAYTLHIIYYILQSN
ncbi:MAG TPA: hypothetical protein PLS08_13420, partial [Chryseolinea sp.]|nr:hypothetical protein [Chryseolinea sp.]